MNKIICVKWYNYLIWMYLNSTVINKKGIPEIRIKIRSRCFSMLTRSDQVCVNVVCALSCRSVLLWVSAVSLKHSATSWLLCDDAIASCVFALPLFRGKLLQQGIIVYVFILQTWIINEPIKWTWIFQCVICKNGNTSGFKLDFEFQVQVRSPMHKLL